MSIRTDLSDSASLLALEICKEFGDVAYYSNKGSANITIYLSPDIANRSGGEQAGADVDLTTQKFFVPKQPNFPPVDGVQINDVITYPTTAAYKYVVTSWESDGLGAGYTLEATRTRATRLV